MEKKSGESLRILGMDAEIGRWALVFLGLLLNLCLGSIYSWSVFVTPLSRYFSETLGQNVTANDVLMPFSVFLAFFALTMPFAGRYIELYGPRTMILVGGVLTGAGWLLASMATTVQMLYVLYGVVGGVGVGIAYGVPVAVAARWFPDRRGLAVGLTLLGFGFSAFFTANVASYLIAGYGVMETFRIFGLVFIILIVLLSLPQVFPPEGWSPSTGGSLSGPVPPFCSVTWREMLRIRAFYGLWICYCIGCLAGLMAVSLAKPVGTEIFGIESGLATVLVGLFAIFNGGGRPLFGFMTDRLTPRSTAVCSFLLIGAASLSIWFIPGQVVYILGFAVLWGSLGGWLAIAPATTGAFFGTRDYPCCYGILFLAYGAGAVAGPQLAGLIKSMTGSYLGVFPVVSFLALAGLIIAWLFLDPPAARR